MVVDTFDAFGNTEIVDDSVKVKWENYYWSTRFFRQSSKATTEDKKHLA